MGVERSRGSRIFSAITISSTAYPAACRCPRIVRRLRSRPLGSFNPGPRTSTATTILSVSLASSKTPKAIARANELLDEAKR